MIRGYGEADRFVTSFSASNIQFNPKQKHIYNFTLKNLHLLPKNTPNWRAYPGRVVYQWSAGVLFMPLNTSSPNCYHTRELENQVIQMTLQPIQSNYCGTVGSSGEAFVPSPGSQRAAGLPPLLSANYNLGP